MADKLAEDILLLDIRGVSDVADYFVMCSGTSERHVHALSEQLSEELVKVDVRPRHIEGVESSGWLLADYGSVVVHIFLPLTRSYYKLEQLWKDARTVVRML